MFAYCLNNPVMYCDASGNACIMTCHGEIDLRAKDYADFRSGCLCGFSRGIRSLKIGAALSDCEKEEKYYTSRGKILPWELLLFGFTSDGLTIIDASLSLMEASFEWENSKLTILELFSAEISVGATATDGVHCNAMESIMSSGFSWDLGILEIEIVGHLGSIGGKFGVDVDNISAGWSLFGIGGEISIQWSFE